MLDVVIVCACEDVSVVLVSDDLLCRLEVVSVFPYGLLDDDGLLAVLM